MYALGLNKKKTVEKEQAYSLYTQAFLQKFIVFD